MKVDLDEIERLALRAIAAEEAAPRALEGARMVTSEVANTSWDHQKATSPPVTLALIARIRELEGGADRAVTIADEAFGIGPVESFDETLGRIECGIHEQHVLVEAQRSRIRELEVAIEGVVDIERSDAAHWDAVNRARIILEKGAVHGE